MNDEELRQVSAEIDALKMLINLAKKCTKYNDVPSSFKVSWTENENKFIHDLTGQLKDSGKALAWTPNSGSSNEIQSKFEINKRKFLDVADEVLSKLEAIKKSNESINKRARVYAKMKDVFIPVFALLVALVSLIVSILSSQKSEDANQISQKAFNLSTNAVEIEIEKQFQGYLEDYLKLQAEINSLKEDHLRRKTNKHEFEHRHGRLIQAAQSTYKALERLIERYKIIGGKSKIVEQFEELKQPQ